MSKQISGLRWYQNTRKFLSENDCYLVFPSDEKQMYDFARIAQTFGGFRVHANSKKYGLIVSRGKKGKSLIVTQNSVEEYCNETGITLSYLLASNTIIIYTAKEFSDSRHKKNVYLKSDARKPYNSQLKSEKWYAFRKFVFDVRGRKCEVCGATKQLQVHHPKYITGRAAWEYTCNDVMVVCRSCHEKLHNKS